MFSHITLGTNDLAKARTFYNAIFAAMGAAPANEPPGSGRLIYTHNGSSLMILSPINGEPATSANGVTIGFPMSSPEQVVAWHDAGVANGGTSCEDPPGLRAAFSAHLAYLRDPDGHKLCAVHRLP